MNEFMREILVLPPQASTIAREIDYLHFFVISMTMLGATVAALAAIIFVVRYRFKRPQLTPRIRAPFWVEGIWIFFLLSLFLLWWVIGFRQYTRLQVAPENPVEIYVTAKQWMWKFAYPQGRSSIGVLTVPANRPVRLNMTSRDVIHSLFIPAFRVKQDVLPGTYTTLWFEAQEPGSHQILCTEYCGVSHSNMLGRVDVLSAEDYEAWLNGAEILRPGQVSASEVPFSTGALPAGAHFQETGMDGALEAGKSERMEIRGREAAVRHGCLACHTLDGRSHIGPSFAGLYGREVEMQDGSKVIADAAYLTQSMMDPRAQIVAGFHPVMPTYQGLLSAGETAALVELIRSLKDIDRGGPFPGRGEVPQVYPHGSK